MKLFPIKAGVLVLMASIIYIGFLSNPYIFDDLALFNKSVKLDDVMPRYHFDWFELRSLPLASFYWTKLLFGEHIQYFRLGNLILHIGVAVSIHQAIYLLFKITVPEHPGKNDFNLISWIVAIVFVVHPAATYAVGYLAQRTILMASLFSIITVILYIRASMTGNRVMLWAAVPTYYLAVFSKEHAIMLPFCLAALTVLFYKDWRYQFRREFAFFSALIGIALIVVYARKHLIGKLYEPNAAGYMVGIDSTTAYFYSILMQAALHFKYLLIWLLPNPNWMSIDMREEISFDLISWQTLLAIAYLIYGQIGIKLLLRRGVAGMFGFGMLFPWLMFLTEFSAVRIQEIFVIYRSYLWSLGWVVMLAVIILKLRIKKSSAMIISVVFTMVFISLERMQTLAHPIIMWDDAVKLIEEKNLVRGTERIYYNRGTELAKIGQFVEAKRDFEKVLSIYPEHIDARVNLGVLYFKQEKWQSAIDQFNTLEKIAEGRNSYMNPRLILGRAISYERLGNSELAQKDFIRSCALAKMGCEFIRE